MACLCGESLRVRSSEEPQIRRIAAAFERTKIASDLRKCHNDDYRRSAPGRKHPDDVDRCGGTVGRVTAPNQTDANLIRLALSTETSAAEQVPAELVAQLVDADGDGQNAQLLQLVLGARELRRRLAVIEVEAANQARENGTTVRRLSEATGISERNIRQRYRRAAVQP